MAGRGKRLRPQSSVTPKPLLTVRGRSMVERIVEGFAGVLPRPVDECVFILGPSFEREARPLLKDICARHRATPRFVVQHEALGTAHAVHVAQEYLSGEGIVVYADTVFDMGASVSLEGSDVVVWVKHVEDPSRFGVAVREGDRVVAFVEKPKEPISTEALIGIYYVRELTTLRDSIQQLFDDNIRGKGGEYYLTDAFDLMLKAGGVFTTASVRHWLDCGTLSAFMDTARHLLQSEEVAIEPSRSTNSVLIPPVHVAPGARIMDSVIGPYVSVERDAQVNGSVIRDSIVFEGAQVTSASIHNSFVGAHSVITGVAGSINVGDYAEIG